MQPTEPTPSPDVQPEVESTADAEPSQSTQESGLRSWWQRITGGGQSESESPGASETEPDAASPSRTFSEEEFQRSVQSEKDKWIAQQNKAARDAERRRLRDEDPDEYAAQERMAEQAQVADQQLTDLLQGIGQAHDNVTLVPLLDALPIQEKQRLMAIPGAGEGTDGRKLLTDEALKSLEKQWRAEGAKDAEAKLRKNTAFRKQVMSEFSGAYPEPELLPAGAPTNGHSDSESVNNLFRQQIGLPTS